MNYDTITAQTKKNQFDGTNSFQVLLMFKGTFKKHCGPSFADNFIFLIIDMYLPRVTRLSLPRVSCSVERLFEFVQTRKAKSTRTECRPKDVWCWDHTDCDYHNKRNINEAIVLYIGLRPTNFPGLIGALHFFPSKMD